MKLMNTVKAIKVDHPRAVLESAKDSIIEQARALIEMAETLDGEFVQAVDLILQSRGRLVISGMGKSGHIGKKIAASLASTGTRAFFMHPSEAFHGDLGMVAPEDIVLLISNSGESDEVLRLIPHLKRFGNKIIGLHGNLESTLGLNSDVNLLVKVNKEICPHNLAPTTSTLAAMAIGDALTVTLMKERNFQPEDFAEFHPGGALGKRLLVSVKESMLTENLPLVEKHTTMRECIILMTKSQTGIAIVHTNTALVGVLTDGDVRRALLLGDNTLDHSVNEHMSQKPLSVDVNEKLAAAEKIMNDNKVNALVVTHEKRVVGLYQNFYI